MQGSRRKGFLVAVSDQMAKPFDREVRGLRIARLQASAFGKALPCKLEVAREGISITWVDRYYPLIRAEDRSRYIEGLRRAGLE